MNSSTECLDDLTTITTVRAALILAGTGVPVTAMNFLRVVTAIIDETPEDTEPVNADWNLYTLEVNNPCPIDRINLPYWLITGSYAALEGQDPDFAAIDPTAWTGGLLAVIEALAPPLVTPDVRSLAAALIESAEKIGPDVLPKIREALRIKGEAIKNNVPRQSDSEHGSINVVIVGL